MIVWNGDVVLADEVVLLARRRLATRRRQASGSPLLLRPLVRRGQVADDGLEPDVDALAGSEILDRDRHAPVDVARDRAVVQAILDEADAEVLDVFAPAGASLAASRAAAPGTRCRLKKKCSVSRISGVAPRELAARVDQLLRVERAAAVVALVAARAARSRSAGRCPRHSGRAGSGRPAGRRTAASSCL